jgi:hypothetical protein
VALHLTREFKYGDFRPGAESDGESGGSNAAVDIELAAGFFVPSADVGRFQAAEEKLRYFSYGCGAGGPFR